MSGIKIKENFTCGSTGALMTVCLLSCVTYFEILFISNLRVADVFFARVDSGSHSSMLTHKVAGHFFLFKILF
jgi:hypothetical protein